MSEQPVFDFSEEANVGRMPIWIRQAFGSEQFAQTSQTLQQHELTTVCVEARCPNRGECWSRGTATFMLLGDTCTRACGFCAVKTGRPASVDTTEPRRVADAVAKMDSKYVVLTSVNRDDLNDGGASIFADVICMLREDNNDVQIELLTPDFFRRQQEAVEIITDAIQSAAGEAHLVWGHNIETVPVLYRRVRKGSDYERSLQLFSYLKDNRMFTLKSAIMLGLGETQQEVKDVLQDLHQAGVQRIAMGQYLRPSRYHLPVKAYITPEQFDEYGQIAKDIGFDWVKSGALVRSSYHADDAADE